jgi:hypothetical protein
MAYSLLALGDSYTIGEGISPEGSFPYQAVHLLQNAGQLFKPPEILARTGWTTDELAAAMSQRQWQPPYDFVTLLIGVNNQYRGRDVQEYAGQFEHLLQEAIRLSARPDPSSLPRPRTLLPLRTLLGLLRHGQSFGKASSLAFPRSYPSVPRVHSYPSLCSGISAAPSRVLSSRVIVLSIPDWSVSPFAHTHLPDAKGRTIADVASAIDTFNAMAAGIARRYDVTFIDITTRGRAAGSAPALYTADGLHPAAGMYRFWAETLAGSILQMLAAGPQVDPKVHPQ